MAAVFLKRNRITLTLILTFSLREKELTHGRTEFFDSLQIIHSSCRQFSAP